MYVKVFGRGDFFCGVNQSSRDQGAWKTFWLKHSGSEYPTTCRAKDCERSATATAHLHHKDDKEHEEVNYLIPVCGHHNGETYDWDKSKTNWFEVKAKTVACVIRENPDVRGH